MSLYLLPEYQEDLETVYRSVPEVGMFREKTILITGAGGMIGSFLVDFFIYCSEKKGFACKIYGTGRDVSKLKKRFASIIGKGDLFFLSHELSDPIGWDIDGISSPDYLIHCAGSGSPSEFMKQPGKIIRDTVTGAYNLLEYAGHCGISRGILVSSGEVYGQASLGKGQWKENDEGKMDYLSPRSCYPLAKRAAENMWSAYGSQTSMKTVIARLCHTYGPTAREEEERVAGLCLSSAAEGRDVVLKSRGEQMRSWCYIADCASGLLTALLAGKPGEAYNVAAQGSATIAEFAGKAAACEGKKVIFSLPADADKRIFNPMDMAVLSAGKLRQLGWREHYTLDMGVERTLRIMRQAVEA